MHRNIALGLIVTAGTVRDPVNAIFYYLLVSIKCDKAAVFRHFFQGVSRCSVGKHLFFNRIQEFVIV